MESTEKKWAYEKLAPTLAKTLLTIGGSCRMPGIRLLNSHCKQVANLDFSSKGERLKNWLSTSEIYIKLLTKDITES